MLFKVVCLACNNVIEKLGPRLYIHPKAVKKKKKALEIICCIQCRAHPLSIPPRDDPERLQDGWLLALNYDICQAEACMVGAWLQWLARQ